MKSDPHGTGITVRCQKMPGRMHVSFFCAETPPDPPPLRHRHHQHHHHHHHHHHLLLLLTVLYSSVLFCLFYSRCV